jgi:hypothetical protein
MNVPVLMQMRIDVFRSLPSLPALTDLYAFNNDITVNQLQLLSAFGSNLPQRLFRIDSGITAVDELVADILPRFTSLTDTDTGFIGIADPTFLHSFKRCTSASIYCEDVVIIDILLPILSEYTALTQLRISHPRLTSTHLSALLAHVICHN